MRPSVRRRRGRRRPRRLPATPQPDHRPGRWDPRWTASRVFRRASRTSSRSSRARRPRRRRRRVSTSARRPRTRPTAADFASALAQAQSPDGTDRGGSRPRPARSTAPASTPCNGRRTSSPSSARRSPASNVQAITAWEQAEGTEAAFNPLATTQGGFAGETHVQQCRREELHELPGRPRRQREGDQERPLRRTSSPRSSRARRAGRRAGGRELTVGHRHRRRARARGRDCAEQLSPSQVTAASDRTMSTRLPERDVAVVEVQAPGRAERIAQHRTVVAGLADVGDLQPGSRRRCSRTAR